MYDSTKPYTERILNLVKNNNSIPASTDGIGTKGIYHWKQRTFRNAVLDALAMNLNDMCLMRAKVIGLHNHIMIPEDDEEAIIEIIENLVVECKKRNISIYSGETAIHNEGNGLEISVSVIGEYVQKKKNSFEEKDVLIGIKSSGLHSNGFTKVRELFEEEYRNEFVEPTIIYSDKILELIEKFDVHGICHITGGAYTKLKKFLDNKDLILEKHNLKPQEIFFELYQRGISDEEMYKTFNCGVGFILSVSKENVNDIINFLKFYFEVDVIGTVISGDGKVRIKSMFSDKEVLF